MKKYILKLPIFRNREMQGSERKWNHTLVNDVFHQMNKDAIAISIAGRL